MRRFRAANRSSASASRSARVRRAGVPLLDAPPIALPPDDVPLYEASASLAPADIVSFAFGASIAPDMNASSSRSACTSAETPPGAMPEVGFLAACTRCGACSPVCPVHAILTVPTSGGLAAGTPYLEPASQPCVACPDMPCVAACPNASAMLFTAAKIAHLALLPQGQPERMDRVRRMVATMDALDFGACSNHGECEAACPKGISLENIALMNRDFVKATIEKRPDRALSGD